MHHVQPDQVPIGHIPRTMTVQCHGDLTRQCTPGDIVTLAGIYLPTRYTGYRAMKAGLIADIYVEVQHIDRLKKHYDEIEATPEMARRLQEATENPDIFRLLARSIAPEIYGHEDVKKALLLQLVGGVTRNLPDGMKISSTTYIRVVQQAAQELVPLLLQLLLPPCMVQPVHISQALQYRHMLCSFANEYRSMCAVNHLVQHFDANTCLYAVLLHLAHNT
eukprot:16590-Heterococcus_DN1.PRE.5